MMLESGDVFRQGILPAALNLQVFPVESDKHWTRRSAGGKSNKDSVQALVVICGFQTKFQTMVLFIQYTYLAKYLLLFLN